MKINKTDEEHKSSLEQKLYEEKHNEWELNFDNKNEQISNPGDDYENF